MRRAVEPAGMSGRARLIAPALVWCGVLSACGSIGAPSGTATGAAGSSPGGSNPGLALARCMRAHGITNFPDPNADGAIQLAPGSGLDPQSPAFQAAQAACSKYAPDKGRPPVTSAAERTKAVAFAKCMRSHGEPGFPDPLLSPPRGVTRVLAFHGMSFAVGPGLDPRSPAFQQAAKDCGVNLPGFGQARQLR
jgi:hypothetical protein